MPTIRTDRKAPVRTPAALHQNLHCTRMNQAVNTAKAERRPLRFAGIDELRAEVDRIVKADQAGVLRCTGNWSAGQVFGHVAAWIDYGYEGYPMKPPPFFIRWILRRKVKQYLRDGMPVGVRIPGVPVGTHGVDELSIDEGAARLRKALARLESGERCPHDSPAFGPMSHDDRIALNLRHAELHLGFLHP